CQAWGISEDILDLLALGGDDTFPLDAVCRDLSPPAHEMRQERAEAMPEQMPLLAGEALHFFNQVVEVEGLKLPGFEQRSLLLYPGVKILVVQRGIGAHSGPPPSLQTRPCGAADAALGAGGLGRLGRLAGAHHARVPASNQCSPRAPSRVQ